MHLDAGSLGGQLGRQPYRLSPCCQNKPELEVKGLGEARVAAVGQGVQGRDSQWFGGLLAQAWGGRTPSYLGCDTASHLHFTYKPDPPKMPWWVALLP